MLRPDAVRRLEHERLMSAMLRRVADGVAKEARRLAPVREERYRDGIEVDVGADDGGHVVGRVNATDFKSWWIEAGTVDTPVFAPLRKAIESGAARRTL